MNSASILLIDDEPQLRQLLARLLSVEGFEVIEADSAKSGLKQLEKHFFEVILLDVKLPDGNGVELTKIIKDKYPETEIILQTAYGKIADGVSAIKNGAFDYLVKGDDNNKIIPLISKAIEKSKLQFKIKELQEQLNQTRSFDEIIGKSPVIQQAISLAKKVASTDSTVLLEGETGVGKELFAQALHYTSQRKNKAFVAVNCSAFPKDLLESELFGHKKGAYTGATNDKKGLFEEAHNGTLFLDEIGEMSFDLQAKLLRVLETQSFIKVGDSLPTKINVRIIAATNRTLTKEVEQEHFRADLYYRLSSFKILVPSLRERKGDIENLATHFMLVYSAKIKKRITNIDTAFLKQLKNYQWKGNIRELKNIIERAVILCETETLTCDLLPLEIIDCESSNLSTLDNSLTSMEKKHIQKTLKYSKGNKTKTAEILGIGLTTLYRKMEEYGIEK
ncbi:MAG TPA: sigma-54 dependent transcriptional regulator [Bacteroidia bacterium]